MGDDLESWGRFWGEAMRGRVAWGIGVLLVAAVVADVDIVEQHGLGQVKATAVLFGDLFKALTATKEWIYFWVLLYFCARNGWLSAGYWMWVKKGRSSGSK